MAPTPIALGKAIESAPKHIITMDIDGIVQLYMETIEVLKKIEQREEVILAEHEIAKPRKRAYTLRDNDVSFGRIFA
jgi:hypothetical protein